MYKLILQVNEADEYTRREVVRFINLKLDEVTEIRGQIAKDLRQLGVDSFADSRSYDKLKAEYLRAHQGKKKLALLEMERRQWCK